MPAKANIPPSERERRRQQSLRDRAANRAAKPAAPRVNRRGTPGSRQKSLPPRRMMYNRDLGRKTAQKGGYARRSDIADMLAYPHEHQTRLPMTVTAGLTALQEWRVAESSAHNPAAATPQGADPGDTLFALIGLPGLMWARTQNSGPITDRFSGPGPVPYKAMFESTSGTTGDLDTIEPVLGKVLAKTTADPFSAANGVLLYAGQYPLNLAAMELIQHGGGKAYPWHGNNMPLVLHDGSAWFYMDTHSQIFVKLESFLSYKSAITVTAPCRLIITVGLQMIDNKQAVDVFPERTVRLSEIPIGVTPGLSGTFQTVNNEAYIGIKLAPPGTVTLKAASSGWCRLVVRQVRWEVDMTDGNTPTLVAAEQQALDTRVSDLRIGMKYYVNAQFGDSSPDADYNPSPGSLADSKNIFELGTLTGRDKWNYHASLNSGNNQVSWRFFCAGQIEPAVGGDRLIGEYCRVSAASILISNVSPAMGKGGIIHCNRLKAGDSSISSTPDDSAFYNVNVISLLGANSYQALMAETGAFTFMIPNLERCGFRQAMEYNGGPFIHYDQLMESYYLMCRVSSTTSTFGTTTPVSNAYNITVDSVVEFTTNSQRYKKGVPHTTMADAESVINALLEGSGDQFWYENPSHVAMVFSFLRNAMRNTVGFVRDNAPKLAAAIGAYNPAYAPAAMLGANLIRR